MQDTEQKCFVISAEIKKYEFFEEFYLNPDDPALPRGVELDLAWLPHSLERVPRQRVGRSFEQNRQDQISCST